MMRRFVMQKIFSNSYKMLEHKIEALGTVKNHVMYILAKEEEKR